MFTMIYAFGVTGRLVRGFFDEHFRLMKGNLDAAAFVLEFTLRDGEVYVCHCDGSRREGLKVRLFGSTVYERSIEWGKPVKLPLVWFSGEDQYAEIMLPSGLEVLTFIDQYQGAELRMFCLRTNPASG